MVKAENPKGGSIFRRILPSITDSPSLSPSLPDTISGHRHVHRAGSKPTFGLNPPHMAEFLAERGFEQIKDVTLEEAYSLI